LAGGPAERAGIKPGDVITSIDGQVINSSDEAIVAVRSHNVGDRIKVGFTRGATSHEISLVLIAAKR
jgi:putative serine protease PepD